MRVKNPTLYAELLATMGLPLSSMVPPKDGWVAYRLLHTLLGEAERKRALRYLPLVFGFDAEDLQLTQDWQARIPPSHACTLTGTETVESLLDRPVTLGVLLALGVLTIQDPGASV